MTEFIQLLFISSLWIWGVRCALMPGQILGAAGEIIATLPKWIYKPTIGCPQCMASVHGTVIYIVAHSFIPAGPAAIVFWLPFVVCLSGLNHIITEFIYDTTIQED